MEQTKTRKSSAWSVIGLALNKSLDVIINIVTIMFSIVVGVPAFIFLWISKWASTTIWLTVLYYVLGGVYLGNTTSGLSYGEMTSILFSETTLPILAGATIVLSLLFTLLSLRSKREEDEEE
ncbi:TPA: hypothetical protein VB851_000207 [Streptococcus suis]|nr:hypothetical protein [Streptococcus suis]